jgi:hypothetical protein
LADHASIEPISRYRGDGLRPVALAAAVADRLAAYLADLCDHAAAVLYEIAGRRVPAGVCRGGAKHSIV